MLPNCFEHARGFQLFSLHVEASILGAVSHLATGLGTFQNRHPFTSPTGAGFSNNGKPNVAMSVSPVSESFSHSASMGFVVFRLFPFVSFSKT